MQERTLLRIGAVPIIVGFVLAVVHAALLLIPLRLRQSNTFSEHLAPSRISYVPDFFIRVLSGFLAAELLS